MSDPRRHPNVVNLAEVEPQTRLKGSKFGATVKWFTPQTGARGVGCGWHEVEPGRAAYPTHFHCANEEAIFVLEGEGTLRIGADTVQLKANDFVTLPTGPDHAHKLTNTGTAPLRYLGLSTLQTAEVVGYPDSGKVGAMAAPRVGERPWLRGIFKSAQQADYFDGEQTE